MLVDGNTFTKPFAFTHPDQEETVNDKVVELCDMTANLQAQIMDHRIVFRCAEAKIDVVGRVLLALDA